MNCYFFLNWIGWGLYKIKWVASVEEEYVIWWIIYLLTICSYFLLSNVDKGLYINDLFGFADPFTSGIVWGRGSIPRGNFLFTLYRHVSIKWNPGKWCCLCERGRSLFPEKRLVLSLSEWGGVYLWHLVPLCFAFAALYHHVPSPFEFLLNKKHW